MILRLDGLDQVIRVILLKRNVLGRKKMFQVIFGIELVLLWVDNRKKGSLSEDGQREVEEKMNYNSF